jgi:SAM-dependent methyltransferase
MEAGWLAVATTRGALYGRMIEPLQRRLHARVADLVPPGLRVLDACSGAGGLALRLAVDAREVVGVDHAPAMVAWAERRRVREGGTAGARVRYVAGDVASALAAEPDGAFDVATMVLALHEMPAAVRGPLLGELCRLAAQVMVVDFRVPMPWNAAGLRNRTLEVAAGPSHFLGFRDFVRRGGVPGIAAAAGLACEHLRDLDQGAMSAFSLTRPG